MVALIKSDNQIAQPQKSNEWYTPSKYIEAAREVMGGIDLDPASCELANETVKAERYYTQAENGLEQAWYGRVWLNPPYGRSQLMKAQGKSTIELFSSKLIEHYHRSEVTQAIFLGTSQIDARWFQPLWEFPICFPGYKVHFLTDGRHTNYAHMFGTCFVYLGPHEHKFIEIFSQFGRIARAIDTPRQEAAPSELWEVTP